MGLQSLHRLLEDALKWHRLWQALESFVRLQSPLCCSPCAAPGETYLIQQLLQIIPPQYLLTTILLHKKAFDCCISTAAFEHILSALLSCVFFAISQAANLKVMMSYAGEPWLVVFALQRHISDNVPHMLLKRQNLSVFMQARSIDLCIRYTLKVPSPRCSLSSSAVLSSATYCSNRSSRCSSSIWSAPNRASLKRKGRTSVHVLCSWTRFWRLARSCRKALRAAVVFLCRERPPLRLCLLFLPARYVLTSWPYDPVWSGYDGVCTCQMDCPQWRRLYKGLLKLKFILCAQCMTPNRGKTSLSFVSIRDMAQKRSTCTWKMQ